MKKIQHCLLLDLFTLGATIASCVVIAQQANFQSAKNNPASHITAYSAAQSRFYRAVDVVSTSLFLIDFLVESKKHPIR